MYSTLEPVDRRPASQVCPFRNATMANRRYHQHCKTKNGYTKYDPKIEDEWKTSLEGQKLTLSKKQKGNSPDSGDMNTDFAAVFP
jgi:hypothetical protein